LVWRISVRRYVRSTVPAEAVTIATLTYASAMIIYNTLSYIDIGHVWKKTFRINVALPVVKVRGLSPLLPFEPLQ